MKGIILNVEQFMMSSQERPIPLAITVLGQRTSGFIRSGEKGNLQGKRQIIIICFRCKDFVLSFEV